MLVRKIEYKNTLEFWKLYYKHVLPLFGIHVTPREVELLSLLMFGGGDITMGINKVIKKVMNIDRSSLSNMYRGLREKGVLDKVGIIQPLRVVHKDIKIEFQKK